MCGRYTLTSTKGIVEELELATGEPAEPSEWWRPRFNVAPTQPAPVVIVRDGHRTLELLRWGLVPPWASSLAEGAKLINARSEGLATRPAFRDALKHRRCLVLADGFLEWRGDGKTPGRDAPGRQTTASRGRQPARTPVYLRPVPRRLVTFAGLWERWRAPDGAWVPSFTIVTGPPNALVAPYHDRMPKVVERADRAAWLVDAILPGLPAVADWQGTDVSRRVSSVVNDDPACLEPEPSSPPVQGSLF